MWVSVQDALRCGELQTPDLGIGALLILAGVALELGVRFVLIERAGSIPRGLGVEPGSFRTRDRGFSAEMRPPPAFVSVGSSSGSVSQRPAARA
jgi:hypothetical protein